MSNILTEQNEKFIAFLPEQFREEFRKQSFIAGGAVYSYLNNIPANDYDFFLKSEELANNIREFFLSKLCGESRDGKIINTYYNERHVIITDNAISFNTNSFDNNIYDWQIVTKWVGEPQDVIAEFDFKHNMLFWDANELLEHNVQFAPNNTQIYYKKQLLFNEDRARDISGILLRIPKFIECGFTITKAEHAKIILALLKTVGVKGTELPSKTIQRDTFYMANSPRIVDWDECDYNASTVASNNNLDLSQEVQSPKYRELEILHNILDY